jgi:hypothetical protein
MNKRKVVKHQNGTYSVIVMPGFKEYHSQANPIKVYGPFRSTLALRTEYRLQEVSEKQRR